MFQNFFEFSVFFFSLLIIIYITFFVNSVVLYDDPLINRLKNDLILVDPRVKNITFYASDASFTEDKKRIYICLKDKNGDYYPYNMLIYVCLHELAHAFSSTIDMSHTSVEFITNFQNLVQKASDIKIYDPSQPIIQGYCSSH